MAKDSAWIGDDDIQLYFVNNEEEEEDVLESFRRRSSQGVFSKEELNKSDNSENIDEDEGFLCFKVALKHHKAKSKTARPIFFIGCKDKTVFSDVLEAVVPHVNADASTSVFMTEDFYGIRSKQTSASIFMKYGTQFELHTGVHLNRVGWHPKN
jgi:hypothetical protein